MKTISRYIMTLALLIMAVGGAWALPATPNSIVINGTPQVGDKSISLTYHFDPNNVSGITSYVPTLKVKCAADNKWDEMTLSLHEVSSATTNISLDNLGEFEAGKTYEVCFAYYNGSWVDDVFQSFVPAAASSDPIEVTTNAAEEGATFTEAWFNMPANDATAEYELVRDMGYKVAFSGVPTRARLAKDGDGKFHFADGLTFQLLDNIDAANPKDITSAEGITFMVGEVEAVDFEGHTFYQLNKETLVPLADFLADAHLGNYAICAVASTGEYDGSFASGMITLFQGYEVEVAAKEFITYYKDEPLYADTETSADAELYTISSVSGDQATLSAAIETAPSLTPLLIFNNSDQAKTFLLIPANEEPNLALTVAPEFQGTLTGTTIAASTENVTNYALNGKAFVFVKSDLAIGANKAWLSINTGVPSARITIVFDETTKITNTNITNITNGNWYDLNGRKLDKMPTKKGVYIMNGKKVVVK